MPYTRAMSCLFCRIAAGEIPATMVFEDDDLVAFDDINPQAPVHTLIIPKQHVSAVQECREQDPDLLSLLLITCTNVAKQKGLTESGYRIVTNTGRDAGQTVFHLHFHVLGGRHMSWPPG